MQLSEATLSNEKVGGDIFQAIEFIVDRISNHCQRKKYNKRAFVFTSGMGATTYTAHQLEKIVDKLT